MNQFYLNRWFFFFEAIWLLANATCVFLFIHIKWMSTCSIWGKRIRKMLPHMSVENGRYIMNVIAAHKESRLMNELLSMPKKKPQSKWASISKYGAKQRILQNKQWFTFNEVHVKLITLNFLMDVMPIAVCYRHHTNRTNQLTGVQWIRHIAETNFILISFN